MDNNTFAGGVKVAVQFNEPTLYHVIYCGQQADGTSSTQTLMPGGDSYGPLDDSLLAPAKDMMDNIGEESDADAETRHANPRSFRTTIIRLQKFKQKFQTKIIGQQQCYGGAHTLVTILITSIKWCLSMY